jgi:hypothetical protein
MTLTNPQSRKISTHTRKRFDWQEETDEEGEDQDESVSQKLVETSIFNEFCTQYSPTLEFLRSGSGLVLSKLFYIQRLLWRTAVPSRINKYMIENENTIVQVDQHLNKY